MSFPSDLEIAQAATLVPLTDIADEMGIARRHLEPYGHSLAKIDLEAIDEMVAAFAAPGGLDAPCAVSYGPIPGSEYATHRFLDVFVHGWDLAVATGQDTTLDPELVALCWAIAEPEAEKPDRAERNVLEANAQVPMRAAMFAE